MSKKSLILANVSDLVVNFLYYDRRDDEELKVGCIEESIKNKEISVDEIVKKFENKLRGSL